MNGMFPRLPALSFGPVWVLNCHSLTVEFGYFMDNKRAHGLSIQLEELPLMLNSQLDWLKKKKAVGFT